MKTTPQKTSPRDSEKLLMEAIRTVLLFSSTLAICILAAMMWGCRPRTPYAASIYERTTHDAQLTTLTQRADTSLTAVRTRTDAVTASEGSDRRLKRIDIERDSAGRPSSILIDETASASSRSATAASAVGERTARTSGRTLAQSGRKEETESVSEERKPDAPKEASTAAKVVIAALAVALILGVVDIATRNRN